MTGRTAVRARLIALGLAAGLAVTTGLGGAARAADDPADIAFWTSVRDSGSAAELAAYLQAFPHGRFAELARIRLQQLSGPGPAPPLPAAATAAAATVRPTEDRLKVIDPVMVDLDARNLMAGSNHRLAIVRAGLPDAVADPTAFARQSTPVPASRTRVALAAAAPGPSEVRLYYIPQFATSFVVAARAAIDILPGTPGATIAVNLVREAAEAGPIRFEARYRDQSVTVEGQFLRAEARTQDQLEWAEQLHVTIDVTKPYAALYLGQLGGALKIEGRPAEIVCLMRAEDRAVLNRVAALNAGDDVTVRGTPSTWQSSGSRALVVVNPCVFAR